MMPDFRLSTRITAAALILAVIAGAAVMFAENMRIHDEYLSERRTDMGTAPGAEKVRLSLNELVCL